MADPFARKVYLRSLASAGLSARYSAGAQRRAAELLRFLGALQGAVAAQLPLAGRPELLALNSADWRRLSSQPYGLPLTRGARRPAVMAAADYPERLLRRFDEVLLRAARQGLERPGDLREYLDLLLGLEWGHALLELSGLRSRAPWLDELHATLLLLLALGAADYHDVRERFLAWAALLLVGGGAEALPLAAFAYPRGRLRLGPLLYFQGRFAACAAELAAARGWGYLASLGGLLGSSDPASALAALEPALAPWLASFPQTEEIPP